jgi:phosphopantetheinyl transferase
VSKQQLPIAGQDVYLWLLPLQGASFQALSAQELFWGQALAPVGSQRYWQSRAALREVLADALGCGPAAVPLHSPPGQPPLLEGGWISLSHSRDGLLLGYAPVPIGVDLERVDRPLDGRALAERFFPPEEVDQLHQLPPDRLRLAVLTSWVAKEAAIKWRQRTLAEELSCWRFDHDAGWLHHRDEGWELKPQMGQSGGWLWAAVLG